MRTPQLEQRGKLERNRSFRLLSAMAVARGFLSKFPLLAPPIIRERQYTQQLADCVTLTYIITLLQFFVSSLNLSFLH
jgi:hypothetical protein